MREKLPETINFPKEELNIQKFWTDNDVFLNSLRLSKNRPRYSFYDGPPFATGLPHYGHILAGTIKDVVTRYAHQSGFYVERRFGWDTHGLPVEFEVEKALGIKGPDDVAKMGIENYNKECRNIVMKYSGEWERVVGRMGRWIDFKNDYKTLYPWFMESVWWVFKELYNKGLVYQGVKVMPFSTGCNTPLSNFESGLNYKEVIDPAVFVAFPLKDEQVSLVAWTTTPWTLPSNLALCCNPNFEYVVVKDSVSKKIYIMLESALPQVYKSNDLYEIVGKRMGSELKGKEYEPPFDYFEHLRAKGAFRVLNDTYVTAETGTGVVHQAPYFGEDDYRCNLQAGIITKDQVPVCPVDSCGKFTEEVRDFKGLYVKTADKEIVKTLLANGKCIKYAGCSHSYPFCWRSDTPLIYKAVPSWFVRVESIKDRLLTSTAETYWVPDYVKEKRFGNWLRDARDWAISRNRYWGTPIPLWISEDKKEIVCVGSIAELEELTGTKITDIHRESVDNLTIPSRRGPEFGVLRRIPEIFDCWFESGSMPYAQMHYPFERVKDFEESFPADFIAEGIDQTRGWFYTLLVISTALFDKPPFKNLVCNGLVLAADGQKMSKSKKNYPDPMEVINRFGADALRLYLINSPVVRAENLRFKEEGVRDVIKDVFLPWYNAFRFLMQNIEGFESTENREFIFDETDSSSDNIMDQWIISFTQTLLKLLKEEMKLYHLYNVVPKLVKYIDNLTNWYVRMNRKRLKGEGGPKDCERALNTLFSVIYTMVRINAPFTPFLSEFMYQRLLPLLPKTKNNESVHYQLIPAPKEELINEETEQAVAHMQTVIDLGRIVRDRKTIPVKYPLPEVVIIHQDSKTLEEIVKLKKYVLEELNVKEMTVTTDKKKYGVVLRAEPDHKTLGVRLRGEFKAIIQAIKELTDAQLQEFLVKKEITVNGYVLGEQDLRLMFSFSGPRAEELSQRYEAHSEGNILILLDITPDESMQNEGIAREIINRVQKLRKKAQLVPTDAVDVYYEIKDSGVLKKVIDEYKEFIEGTTRTPQFELEKLKEDSEVIIEEMQKIKGQDMKLVLVKRNSNKVKPFLQYVNVKLVDVESQDAKAGDVGTVLLQSPKNGEFIDLQRLKEEITVIFGLYGKKFELYDGKNLVENNLLGLDKKTVLVVRKQVDGNEETGMPACKFVNVKSGDKKVTLLLENPRGRYLVEKSQLKKKINELFGVDVPEIDLEKAVLEI